MYPYSMPVKAWKVIFFLLIFSFLFICSREATAMRTDESVLAKKPLIDGELPLKVETATFALG